MKQIFLAKLLLIAEFVYNHAKNISISHMPFELTCSYQLYHFLKKDINFCYQSKTEKK